RFSIACGEDTLLLLFGLDGGSWREVLRWQKEPYTTISGGTLAFQYAVSPSDEAGRWFAVVDDVAPWGSSTWSASPYSGPRPDADRGRPNVLLSDSNGIWWGSEDFGSLAIEQNAFDLRFHYSSIDAGIHNRVWIRRYSVIGDAVRRTPPVAVSPRDFVDE